MFVPRYILLAFTLTLLLASNVFVEADYVVHVTGIDYIKNDDRCASCSQQMGQNCCDEPCAPNGGDTCDTGFLYCLRSLSRPQLFSGFAYCSPVVPAKFTPTFQMDSNNVDFSQSTVLGLSNPVELTGLTTRYQGVTLYVWVYDDDNGERDTIDEFFINITDPINVLRSGMTYFGIHSIARIVLSLRVTCAEFYYGTFCENLNQCELNAANSNNCNGRGICTDGEAVNEYSCECESGFAGRDCELVDYCSINSVDCGENGECVNTMDTDNLTGCLCNDGYGGLQCETREGVVSSSLRVIIATSIIAILAVIVAVVLAVILAAVFIRLCYRKERRPVQLGNEETVNSFQQQSETAIYEDVTDLDQLMENIELEKNESYGLKFSTKSKAQEGIELNENVAYGQSTQNGTNH